jgi:peroxiredoxin/YHS domain-containing protein
MSYLLSFLLFFSFLPAALWAAVGEKAPDFSFPKEGKSVTLSSLLKTNRVVLVYFGDDTAPSWKQLSNVNALLSEYQYRGSNLELLPIIPGKKPEELANLAEEHWLDAGLISDLDRKIAKSFKVDGYPWMAVVDPFGVVQFTGSKASEDELRTALNAVVDKPAVKAFCPVDKMWVVVSDKTPSVVYKGQRFYFCTPEDHDGRRMDREFLQDPERYAKEAKVHLAQENEKRKSAAVQESDGGEPPLYQCPMKDAPLQNEPGRCPKCGMLLEKMEG